MSVRAAAAAAARGAAANGQSSNVTKPFTSILDAIRASRATADPSQTSTGTTGGLMQGTSAGMVSGVDQASGVAGGLMQDASSAVVPSGGGRDLESRVTALEQDAPSNTLGTAKPVFSAQAQQAAANIYGEKQVPGTFDRSSNNIEMARSAAAGSSPQVITQGVNDERQVPGKLDRIEMARSVAAGGLPSLD